MQPLEPRRPSPSKEPISTLSLSSKALEELEDQIQEKRSEMGRRGVLFSIAKNELRDLLRQKQSLQAADFISDFSRVFSISVQSSWISALYEAC